VSCAFVCVAEFLHTTLDVKVSNYWRKGILNPLYRLILISICSSFRKIVAKLSNMDVSSLSLKHLKRVVFKMK
jgi:hypothetical protein